MTTARLIYHDVLTSKDAFSSSGFKGAAADSYKLTQAQFESHLQAISNNLTSFDKISNANGEAIITVDDGGSCNISVIAPALENHKVKGLFFIPTKYIGTAGFMTSEEIKQLRLRGHQIGTHSHSHPNKISSLSHEEIFKEWRQSKEILEDILNETVSLASVPGGFYSRKVASAAAKANIRTLFTSEPQVSTKIIDSVTVLGRFSIKGSTSTSEVAGLAYKKIPRMKQRLSWETKKLFKLISGDKWFQLVERIFENKG